MLPFSACNAPPVAASALPTLSALLARACVRSLRPLDSSFFVIPPQARECVLAYLRAPGLDQDYGRDCALALSDVAWGRQLLCRIHARDAQGKLVVTLHDGEEPASVNEQLVRGWEKNLMLFFRVFLLTSILSARLLLA